MACSQTGCAATGPKPWYCCALSSGPVVTPAMTKTMNGAMNRTLEACLKKATVKKYAVSVSMPGRKKPGRRRAPITRSMT